MAIWTLAFFFSVCLLLSRLKIMGVFDIIWWSTKREAAAAEAKSCLLSFINAFKVVR